MNARTYTMYILVVHSVVQVNWTTTKKLVVVLQVPTKKKLLIMPCFHEVIPGGRVLVVVYTSTRTQHTFTCINR